MGRNHGRKKGSPLWERNKLALPDALQRIRGGPDRFTRDRVTAAVEAACPEGKGPALVQQSVTLQVTKANLLEAEAVSLFDYEGIQATRRCRRRQSLASLSPDYDRPTRARKLGERVRELLGQVAQCLTEDLPPCYPAMEPGDREFSRTFDKVNYSGFAPPPEAMSFQEVDQAAAGFLEEGRDRLRQAICSRLGQGGADTGLLLDCFPGTLTGLDVCVRLDSRGSLNLEALVQLHYAAPISRKLSCTLPCFICDIRTPDREAAVRAIRQGTEGLLRAMEQEIRSQVPLREISQGEIPEGRATLFPPALWQMAVCGCMGSQLRCSLAGDAIRPGAKARRLFQLQEDQFAVTREENLDGSIAFRLSPEKVRREMETLPPLNRLHRLPPGLGGKLALFLEMERVYRKAPWPRKIPKPALLLRMGEDGTMTVSGRDVPEISLDWTAAGDTLDLRLNDLLERVRLSVDSDTRIYLAQLKVFSRLNPAQMTILRFLQDSEDGLTQEELQMGLEGKIPTTGSGTAEVLQDLTDERAWSVTDTEYQGEDLHNPDTEDLFPLVVSEVRRLSWGYCSLYRVSPALRPDALAKAQPRPFSAAELSLLTLENRESWFLERMEHIETLDDRWLILNILENQMPPEFASRFAQSESGARFFRSMGGVDAGYVRYFLENLPGCGELALQLLPEEG